MFLTSPSPLDMCGFAAPVLVCPPASAERGHANFQECLCAPLLSLCTPYYPSPRNGGAQAEDMQHHSEFELVRFAPSSSPFILQPGKRDRDRHAYFTQLETKNEQRLEENEKQKKRSEPRILTGTLTRFFRSNPPLLPPFKRFEDVS